MCLVIFNLICYDQLITLGGLLFSKEKREKVELGERGVEGRDWEEGKGIFSQNVIYERFFGGGGGQDFSV